MDAVDFSRGLRDRSLKPSEYSAPRAEVMNDWELYNFSMFTCVLNRQSQQIKYALSFHKIRLRVSVAFATIVMVLYKNTGIK